LADQGGRGVTVQKMSGKKLFGKKLFGRSPILPRSRDGFSAFLPHASPFELIQATAARYPDRPAIRYLARH
jgi:hypothetical protein